jgi:thaumarchaeosortase
METKERWMLTLSRKIRTRRTIGVLRKFLPPLSFIIPFLILYRLSPQSFEATWKGRAFYLFFLWVSFLETTLGWENLQPKNDRLLRTIAFTLTLLLPTLYIVLASYGGLNAWITAVAKQHKVYWADWMALSTEYLVFAFLFSLILLLEYGRTGLRTLPISILFLGFIGGMYTIDNLYPFGRFAPLQLFVPATATLAAYVLNVLGYRTRFLPSVEGMPTLVAWNMIGSARFQIAWPCSGVESLLLYAIILLLFLRITAIPWKQKMIYFLVGAAVTYLINILRVTNLFVITIHDGDWRSFHNYYGQLYSIIWITFYPLIVTGSLFLRRKLKLAH